MTIKQFIQKKGYDDQPTSSSTYYDALTERFNRERQQRVPRSKGSWEAEQNRLGSWSGGVGVQRVSGSGTPFSNGRGNPLIGFDPDEVEGRNRIT